MQQARNPIAVRRDELGKTQGEFGREYFGVSGMTVWRWEKGASLPRRKHWPKLESVVGRPISEILAAAESGGAK